MKESLVVSANVTIPNSELNFSFSRASGPGGQNVNKVSSKATLHWNVETSQAVPFTIKERFRRRFQNKINSQGEFVISSSETRDQSKNIYLCLQRLREALKQVLTAPKKRIKTKPSKGSKERRIQSKKLHAKKKSLRHFID